MIIEIISNEEWLYFIIKDIDKNLSGKSVEREVKLCKT